MTEFVCLDQTVIRLTSTSGAWGFGVSVAPSAPNYGSTLDVTITATPTKLTVGGITVIKESDITTAMAAAGDVYHSLAGGLWTNIPPAVGGLDGTVAGASITSGLIVSSIFSEDSNGVILDTSSGNFNITRITPALFAAVLPAVPIPDVTPIYSGTWAVQSNGGNTKLKSN